ncbi:hypothetical protein RJ640_027498 [Escallonia rubra]|uniref:CSC1/OSCA1-like 7TM region domain-containing protein n=1 Tax=Escallonia rubra TaxID=112253 RepID=A0AA88QXX7_9ASTE|nr:hypothetical protein RJ640_027498 [Escallonia rubra]
MYARKHNKKSGDGMIYGAIDEHAGGELRHPDDQNGLLHEGDEFDNGERFAALSSLVLGSSSLLMPTTSTLPMSPSVACSSPMGGNLWNSKVNLTEADFFMTYILTSGLSGFSLEILQPGLLMWDTLKSHTWSRGKKKSPYLYSIPYYRVVPFVALFMMIGMVYAVVAPLLLPFLIGYFLLGYVVFINQIQDVYETTYETFGQYWPYIHHYILLAIIIMQITMIGLFGLKSKPSASFATIPLLLFTIAFNEYCKIRFFPTFCHYSVQDAMKDDELDRKNGLMEANCQNALDAYLPPCLRPENLGEEESSSTQPRICSM